MSTQSLSLIYKSKTGTTCMKPHTKNITQIHAAPQKQGHFYYVKLFFLEGEVLFWLSMNINRKKTALPTVNGRLIRYLCTRLDLLTHEQF